MNLGFESEDVFELYESDSRNVKNMHLPNLRTNKKGNNRSKLGEIVGKRDISNGKKIPLNQLLHLLLHKRGTKNT